MIWKVKNLKTRSKHVLPRHTELSIIRYHFKEASVCLFRIRRAEFYYLSMPPGSIWSETNWCVSQWLDKQSNKAPIMLYRASMLVVAGLEITHPSSWRSRRSRDEADNRLRLISISDPPVRRLLFGCAADLADQDDTWKTVCKEKSAIGNEVWSTESCREY